MNEVAVVCEYTGSEDRVNYDRKTIFDNIGRFCISVTAVDAKSGNAVHMILNKEEIPKWVNQPEKT